MFLLFFPIKAAIKLSFCTNPNDSAVYKLSKKQIPESALSAKIYFTINLLAIKHKLSYLINFNREQLFIV